MTKKLISLLLIIIAISCQRNSSIDYADDLKTCLSDNDVEVLNKATEHFEKLLSDHYKSSNSNENYYKYLTDLSSLQTEYSFDAQFYLNSKSIDIVKEMEETGTFTKIWSEYVEMEEENEEEIFITSPPEDYVESEEETKGRDILIHVLNPSGSYLECVNKESDNETIKEVLNSQAELGGISPTFVANALKQGMKTSDFDNGLNKVVIAVGFYYETVVLLSKNKN